jgi:hypothetical protein
LENGLRIEKENRNAEIQKLAPQWWRCIDPLVRCEYIDKLKEVLKRGSWEEYKRNNSWEDVWETTFKALLTSIVSNDSYLMDFFVPQFHDPLISANLNFTFAGSVDALMVFPGLVFKGNYIDFKHWSSLLVSMLNECRLKRSLMKEGQADDLGKLEKALTGISAYFAQFAQEEIPFSEYVKIRQEMYPELVEHAIEANRQKQSNEVIAGFLKQIEEQKLKRTIRTFDMEFTKG